jgi:hypothetical protein
MDRKVEEALNNAKRIPVTDEEDELFKAGKHVRAIARISERTGIPLSSGRVAYAPAIKCLLVVD